MTGNKLRPSEAEHLINSAFLSDKTRCAFNTSAPLATNLIALGQCHSFKYSPRFSQTLKPRRRPAWAVAWMVASTRNSTMLKTPACTTTKTNTLYIEGAPNTTRCWGFFYQSWARWMDCISRVHPAPSGSAEGSATIQLTEFWERKHLQPSYHASSHGSKHPLDSQLFPNSGPAANRALGR